MSPDGSRTLIDAGDGRALTLPGGIQSLGFARAVRRGSKRGAYLRLCCTPGIDPRNPHTRGMAAAYDDHVGDARIAPFDIPYEPKPEVVTTKGKLRKFGVLLLHIGGQIFPPAGWAFTLHETAATLRGLQDGDPDDQRDAPLVGERRKGDRYELVDEDFPYDRSARLAATWSKEMEAIRAHTTAVATTLVRATTLDDPEQDEQIRNILHRLECLIERATDMRSDRVDLGAEFERLRFRGGAEEWVTDILVHAA